MFNFISVIIITAAEAAIIIKTELLSWTVEKCFTGIILFNPRNSLRGDIISLFYRWENWGTEKLHNLSKVTQLINYSNPGSLAPEPMLERQELSKVRFVSLTKPSVLTFFFSRSWGLLFCQPQRLRKTWPKESGFRMIQEVFRATKYLITSSPQKK